MLETAIYQVKLTFAEPVLGTIPKDPHIYERFVASRAPEGVDTTGEADTVPADDTPGWTGFHHDEEGYFLYDYAIRGFLKEAGNVLKDVVGVKALKSKIDNTVFIRPRKIRLPQQVDGVVDRPLRAETAKGPRVSLARSDYFKAGTTIEFEIHVLPGQVSENVLKTLLEYGSFKGVGQFRNGSYGQFSYELRKA